MHGSRAVISSKLLRVKQHGRRSLQARDDVLDQMWMREHREGQRLINYLRQNVFRRIHRILRRGL